MDWWNKSAAFIVCRHSGRQLCTGSSMPSIVPVFVNLGQLQNTFSLRTISVYISLTLRSLSSSSDPQLSTVLSFLSLFPSFTIVTSSKWYYIKFKLKFFPVKADLCWWNLLCTPFNSDTDQATAIKLTGLVPLCLRPNLWVFCQCVCSSERHRGIQGGSRDAEILWREMARQEMTSQREGASPRVVFLSVSHTDTRSHTQSYKSLTMPTDMHENEPANQGVFEAFALCWKC